jgi:hypothetical protein
VVLCLPLISPVLNEVRVAQSFAFCVVLCLPLISPVLIEVRVAQPFTFCVVLCLPLISPVLNDVHCYSIVCFLCGVVFISDIPGP